jgi:hypothetical protein
MSQARNKLPIVWACKVLAVVVYHTIESLRTQLKLGTWISTTSLQGIVIISTVIISVWSGSHACDVAREREGCIDLGHNETTLISLPPSSQAFVGLVSVDKISSEMLIGKGSS